MKKAVIVLSIIFIMAMCMGCGEYNDVAGKYVKSGTSFTTTITLSSSGEFKLERTWKKTNDYNPYNDNRYNYIGGTFKRGDRSNQIEISFTYYKNEIEGNVKGYVIATISGNKLTITENDRVAGTYIKQ